MIELNNIDFSTLERTRILPAGKRDDFWNRLFEVDANIDTMSDLAVTAFELGASLAHQQETKKVCLLLKPV